VVAERNGLKLTDDIQNRMATALRAGNYALTAAQFAGISRTTYYRWLAHGETAREKADAGEALTVDEERYLTFLTTVEEARANATVRNVQVIQKAAQEGTWQAAAWWLERTDPKAWGRRTLTEVSGPNEGPVQINVGVDELESMVRDLLHGTDSEDRDGDRS
jgi:hypothetical protein